ncbi:alx, partial [Symbiodinium pilosum]
YLGIVDAEGNPDRVDDWLDGYIVELILSMENIFLYEMILVSFRVPPKLSRQILYVTSFCQMFFQLWLFMFVAVYLQDIKSLPYLLGAWLMYVGIASLREDDHGSFDPESSDFFKALRTALGSRLLPYYPSDGSMLRTQNGKLCMTMLLPVTVVIIVIMVVMEVDVTLAKIETIDSHFIAWTSSVLVAFALPDLYVIVSELFKQFYLMRTGISALLLFFGGLLLVREEVQISDTVEIGVMLTIVFGSIILSTVMDLGPKSGAAYDESETDEVEDSPMSDVDAAKSQREIRTNAEATLFSLY